MANSPRLDNTKQPVAIERRGRAVAVNLSKDEYDDLHEIPRQQVRPEVDKGLAAVECGAQTDYRADYKEG